MQSCTVCLIKGKRVYKLTDWFLLLSTKILFFFCRLTGPFEAVSDAAGPTYVVDEGAEHVAPEVICSVLTLLIDQPEATANDLLH